MDIPEYFKKVVDNLLGYRYGWSVQFLKGTCLERLKDSDSLPESEANQQIEQDYQPVVKKYPDCPLAEEACLKLGWMNFKREQWVEAAQYFELFLSKYAGNE